MFNDELSGATIALSAPLTLPLDLTIDASALPLAPTLSGGGSTRVLGGRRDHRHPAGLTIANGWAPQEGCGIANVGNLTVDRCLLTSNRAFPVLINDTLGGAIANYGNLTVTDSQFLQNSVGIIKIVGITPETVLCPGHGGAIYNALGATLTAKESGFSGNSALGRGGAILSAGALSVADSWFEEGSAQGGGAIYTAGPTTAMVESCSFTGNRAPSTSALGDGQGGAIATEGPLAVLDSSFQSHTATLGGALYNGSAADTEIATSSFHENEATNLGGGVANFGAIAITATDVTSNTANSGGGLSNGPGAQMSVAGCSLLSNVAGEGGGGIINQGVLEVDESSLFANVGSLGGGLATSGRTVTVRASTLASNAATDSGGGVFSASDLTVINSTLSGNSAWSAGGGICTYVAGTLTLTASTLVGNSAPLAGGLLNGVAATISHSILAHSGDGVDCLQGTGAVVATGPNLIMTGDCPAALTSDPLLASLADNGGPTQTYALEEGSPAVNAGGSEGCLATDQRGVARPQGEGCDLGAHEQETPGVRTDLAADVTATSATLRGAVLPRGWEASAIFEFGGYMAYGTVLAASPCSITGTGQVPISAAVTGLVPNTTYHYRAVATNGSETGYGEDKTFTTDGLPPVATTDPAEGVTAGGATLRGRVIARDDPTAVRFQYGLTTAYGTTVSAAPPMVTGLGETEVSLPVGGLLPDTTCHLRVVAENGKGTTVGEGMTFTTLTAPSGVYVPLIRR